MRPHNRANRGNGGAGCGDATGSATASRGPSGPDHVLHCSEPRTQLRATAPYSVAAGLATRGAWVASDRAGAPAQAVRGVASEAVMGPLPLQRSR
jgi:hypothetical protein